MRPVFNYSDCLSRLGGDRQLFDEILEFFLEDGPALLDQARQALARQDAQSVERAAHSLKGLTANFTADSASAAAYAVELHARERHLASAAACFGELETQMKHLEAALREFRDRSSSG